MYEERCLCLNTTISCFLEKVYVVPRFLPLETVNVKYIDLQSCGIETLPTWSRGYWPNLLVSYLLIYC